MRNDKSVEDLYSLRRKNMKQHLKFGDIKILAKMLMSEYPDITNSSQKDFANYLSQVFNLNSKRPFKDELARRIESVWPPLDKGDLDLSEEKMMQLLYAESHPKELFEIDDYEKALINEDKWERDLKAGKKEDSIIPSIAKDALKWRLVLKFNNWDVQVEENKILDLPSGKYIADLIVTDSETGKKLAIAETGQYLGGLARLIKQSHLRKLMIEANIEIGVLAIYDGNDFTMSWEGSE